MKLLLLIFLPSLLLSRNILVCIDNSSDADLDSEKDFIKKFLRHNSGEPETHVQLCFLNSMHLKECNYDQEYDETSFERRVDEIQRFTVEQETTSNFHKNCVNNSLEYKHDVFTIRSLVEYNYILRTEHQLVIYVNFMPLSVRNDYFAQTIVNIYVDTLTLKYQFLKIFNDNETIDERVPGPNPLNQIVDGSATFDPYASENFVIDFIDMNCPYFDPPRNINLKSFDYCIKQVGVKCVPKCTLFYRSKGYMKCLKHNRWESNVRCVISIFDILFVLFIIITISGVLNVICFFCLIICRKIFGKREESDSSRYSNAELNDRNRRELNDDKNNEEIEITIE